MLLWQQFTFTNPRQVFPFSPQSEDPHRNYLATSESSFSSLTSFSLAQLIKFRDFPVSTQCSNPISVQLFCPILFISWLITNLIGGTIFSWIFLEILCSTFSFDLTFACDCSLSSIIAHNCFIWNNLSWTWMVRCPEFQERNSAESHLGLVAFLSFVTVFYKGFVFMQKEEL